MPANSTGDCPFCYQPIAEPNDECVSAHRHEGWVPKTGVPRGTPPIDRIAAALESIARSLSPRA